MPVRLVAFDVGEVLVDEARLWGGWADRLGVPRPSFFAAFGAVIDERRHHREVFERVRASFDVSAPPPQFWSELGPADLYPDAAPCLRRLRERGYRTAIVGNVPRPTIPGLRRLGIEADLMASSGEWGTEKPSAGFFTRLIVETNLPAAEIAYVGDRIDNDVLPAKRAGMISVFLRRGPWGIIQANWPEAAGADL